MLERGAKDVTIAVDKGNRAIRLYQRLGYSQLGEEKQEHWTRTYKGRVIEEDITLIYLEKNL